MRYKHTAYISILLPLTCYVTLAAKNPFDTRSLIPNLEPYPDTLYYLTPAWNFIQGEGFYMSVFGITIKNIYIPLYSLYNTVWLAIFQDPRAFYFGNIALGIVTILVSYLTLKKLFSRSFSSHIVITIALCIFATNYYIYTLPTIAMAENIALCIVSIMIYMLSIPTTSKKVIIAGLIGTLLVSAKIVALPIALVFYGLYFLKVRKDRNLLLNYVLAIIIGLCLVGIYAYQSGFLQNHTNLQSGTSFSMTYVLENMQYYAQALFHGSGKFLWFDRPVIAPMFFWMFLVSIVLVRKHHQKVLFFAPLALIAQFSLTIVYFYQDTRFIFILFPLINLGIALLFYRFISPLNNKTATVIGFVIIGAYLAFPTMSQSKTNNILEFKRQIGLNLFYKEQPWNYLAVEEFNRFFYESNQEDTYLGTFLPPFYISMFQNNRYQYLPVTSMQEFSADNRDVLGSMYSGQLYDTYSNLLKEGNSVYVSNYYAANVPAWIQEFNKLLNIFNGKLVHTGCHDACNIYQLTLQ